VNKNSLLEAETLHPTAYGASREAAGPIALVILAHPDRQRVGELTTLSGSGSTSDSAPGSVRLSRLEPLFTTRRGRRPQPLASPHLSRRPSLGFEARAEGGVRIERLESEVEIRVDGELLAEGRTIPEAELERGVTLLLARSVCLLVLRLNDLAFEWTVGDDGMVGESSGLQKLRRAVQRTARAATRNGSSEPVLVRGETGTGKELVALSLHRQSLRHDTERKVVNMATLGGELGASSLFGSVRGAFTGALDRQGYFHEADGKTLVLDEIGFADAKVQQALLRAIDNREICRVGSTRAETVDVWVIASTDRRLEQEMEEGRFLAPLFHRLEVNTIRVPPLRERREDIPRLFYTFVHQRLESFGRLDRLLPDDRGRSWIPASLVDRLVRHGWPGNVRQLRNFAWQLVDAGLDEPRMALSPEQEAELGPQSRNSEPREDVPAASGVSSPSSSSPSSSSPPAAVGSRSAGDYADVDSCTDEEIERAMEAAEYVVSRAATRLGVSRGALISRLKRDPNFRLAGDIDCQELAAALDEIGFDPVALARHFRVSKKGLKDRIRKCGLHPEDRES
jgi:two-component system nitrogen regulation response regulator GlnG